MKTLFAQAVREDVCLRSSRYRMVSDFYATPAAAASNVLPLTITKLPLHKKLACNTRLFSYEKAPGKSQVKAAFLSRNRLLKKVGEAKISFSMMQLTFSLLHLPQGPKGFLI